MHFSTSYLSIGVSSALFSHNMAATQEQLKGPGVEVMASKEEQSSSVEVKEMSKDEHHLATLGYKQVFIRSFGIFENWAATFVSSCACG